MSMTTAETMLSDFRHHHGKPCAVGTQECGFFHFASPADLLDHLESLDPLGRLAEIRHLRTLVRHVSSTALASYDQNPQFKETIRRISESNERTQRAALAAVSGAPAEETA